MSFSQLPPRREPHDGPDPAPPPSVLEQALGLIRRRWQLALGVWVLVMAIAVVVLWTLPRQYQSTARILVKNVRQQLLVGPNDQTTALYRDDVPEATMNTELELLRSRDVLAQVATRLKLTEGHLAAGKTPDEAAELAIHELASGLGVEALRKANLIQVSYTSTDAQLANAVLQNVAEAYLARHLALHSNPGTYELFQNEASESRRELQEAQEQLAAVARSSNLVMLDKQKEEALRIATEAEESYASLTAEMQDMAARVRLAEAKKLQVPARLETVARNLPNQYSTERLNTLIVELKNKRTELLTKFNPDDRLVQEVEQQIADTTAALANAERLSVDEKSTNVNPAWQQLETESLRAQLALAGLTDKASQTRKQLAAFRTRAQELAEAGPRYEMLLRNVAQAQMKYDLYVKKEEEARIAGALDHERISNVVLAQAPYVATVPSSPNVRLGLVIGGSIASVLAACAVIAAEHLATLPLFVRRRRASGVEAEGAPATIMS